jgi:hypothetical protein
MVERTAPVCKSASHFGEWSYTDDDWDESNSQAIAIFGSIFRTSVNPAQFGVVLTYALHAALGKCP